MTLEKYRAIGFLISMAYAMLWTLGVLGVSEIWKRKQEKKIEKKRQRRLDYEKENS